MHIQPLLPGYGQARLQDVDFFAAKQTALTGMGVHARDGAARSAAQHNTQ